MQPCWAEETSFKTLENITDPNLNTFGEVYSKCINKLLYGNYLYHYHCLFYFILQNKSTITIITFMNVDGAFILAEICRIQEDLSAYVCWQQHADISHYELGKMFVTRITLSHAFKKIIKMSKLWVSVSALWTLNPGAASSCSAVWIHAIRACFRKHNILWFIC